MLAPSVKGSFFKPAQKTNQKKSSYADSKDSADVVHYVPSTKNKIELPF